MNELVQRLCEASVDNTSAVYEQTWPHSLLREAANRIQELERGIAVWEKDNEHMVDRICKLENALREIATRPGSPDLLRRIARRALEGKKGS